jgi:hypothetical protein
MNMSLSLIGSNRPILPILQLPPLLLTPIILPNPLLPNLLPFRPILSRFSNRSFIGFLHLYSFGHLFEDLNVLVGWNVFLLVGGLVGWLLEENLDG